LYVPEASLLFDEVKRSAEAGVALDRDAISRGADEIKSRYFATPLCDMRSQSKNFSAIASRAASAIEKINF
jgi:hypothetical protein